jgi:hypothetical protein
MSFIVIGFSPERFLVSIFPASEKFDSDLELDAGMHLCPPKTHGHGYGHPMWGSGGIYISKGKFSSNSSNLREALQCFTNTAA